MDTGVAITAEAARRIACDAAVRSQGADDLPGAPGGATRGHPGANPGRWA
jgi:hypothetical protein